MSNFTTVAALDLGSNSFRLTIARIAEQKITILQEKRIRVQLAKGLDDHNYLTDVAIERAVLALTDFQKILDGYTLDTVKAVATNTFRVAKNVEVLLNASSQVFAYPIEVVNGPREAELIYYGVVNHLSCQKQQNVVVDIGGGSTEVVVGDAHKPIVAESFTMGCISLQKQFFSSELIHADAFKDATEMAVDLMKPQCQKFSEFNFDHVYGCSGTIGALWGIINHMGIVTDYITLQMITDLTHEITRLGCYDQLESLGITRDRKVIFPGGLAIVHALFITFNIKRMSFSHAALRDGILALVALH